MLMDFKKVLAGAILSVFENRAVVAQVLMIPFFAFVAVGLAGYLDLNALVSTGLSVVGVCIQVVFAITTHRVVMLGPDSVSKWGVISWSKRETFFLLHLVAIGLMITPLALLGIIPVAGWIIAIALIAYLMSRLSLVFPSIAINEGAGFKLSWQLTKNYQTLMLLVMVVVPLTLSIPTFIVGFIPYGFVVADFLSLILVVFEVAVLSMSYRLIVQKEYADSKV